MHIEKSVNWIFMQFLENVNQRARMFIDRNVLLEMRRPIWLPPFDGTSAPSEGGPSRKAKTWTVC